MEYDGRQHQRMLGKLDKDICGVDKSHKECRRCKKKAKQEAKEIVG